MSIQTKKSDIVDEFEKYFVTMGDMKKFLEYKKNPSLHIPDDILFEALNILEWLSQYFLNDRKTKQLW